jgi:hypothetical protein
MMVTSFRGDRRHVASIQQRLNCSYQQLVWKRRHLMNMAVVFRNDLQVNTLQCNTAIERLITLRRHVQQTCEFLYTLDPVMMSRVKPSGCITKLCQLEELLTEEILSIAMLVQVCEIVCFERLDLHLSIRALFPRLLTSFEDAVSQIAALLEQQQDERGEQRDVS